MKKEMEYLVDLLKLVSTKEDRLLNQNKEIDIKLKEQNEQVRSLTDENLELYK